jgi:hypothetical protein
MKTVVESQNDLAVSCPWTGGPVLVGLELLRVPHPSRRATGGAFEFRTALVSL